MFLVYGGEDELVVKSYTNASFQTDRDDSRPQSGFVFILNGGAVGWRSSKQDTVADSTTEVEQIAASEAATEGVWVKNFVSDPGVVEGASNPLDLYCRISYRILLLTPPAHSSSVQNEQKPRLRSTIIPISLETCIGVTLYDELILTSINQEHILSPS